MRRYLTLAAATLLAGVLAAGTAGAAEPIPIYGPGTKAAAKVSAKGKLYAAKNIDRVTHPEDGVYCLHISNPNVDLKHSVAVGNQENFDILGGAVNVRTSRTVQCRYAADTLTVAVTNANGHVRDADFSVAVL